VADHLFEDGGELSRDAVPREPLARRFPSGRPPSRALVGPLDHLGHGVRERPVVVRLGEPAGPAIVDDQLGAERARSDHRQAARHRLDQHLAELLALAGHYERIGG
jgi:hypothetical protein